MRLTHSLDCNIYAVHRGDGEWFLVDAGCGEEPERIVRMLRKHGVSMDHVKTVFLTHGHADHAIGAKFWKSKYNLEIVAGPIAARWLRDGDRKAACLDRAIRAGAYWPGFPYPRLKVDAVLRAGDVRRYRNGTLTAIASDGHCVGRFSYLWKSKSGNVLFSGDALFPDGKIVVALLPDSDLNEAADSVQRLLKLKFGILCAGHGSPQKVGPRTFEKTRQRLAKLLPPDSFL